MVPPWGNVLFGRSKTNKTPYELMVRVRVGSRARNNLQ